MKVKLVLLSMMLFSLLVTTKAQIAPKREFRGVWMHTVFSDDYAQKSNEQIKNEECKQDCFFHFSFF